VDHQVIGTVMPVLEMKLDSGESVVAESGELSWMNGSIELSTSAGKTAGSKGLFGAVKRAIGGGSLFMTEYRANGSAGMVAFATKVPGHILPVEVGGANEYLIHRGGYLCGEPAVELSIAVQQKLGAGLFGGAGFVLQKVSGQGQAWVELDGEVVTYELGPGETMRVHPGHIGMLDATVSFTIDRIKGVKNIVFGAETLFLAALTGPGKVWLQTLPLPNLAAAINPYIVHPEAKGNGGGGSGIHFGSDND
jgi:uncharacterized protein (AIM24 family)